MSDKPQSQASNIAPAYSNAYILLLPVKFVTTGHKLKGQRIPT